MECSPKPISEDPFGKSVRTDWPIDFGYAFLNHGSFGSVPVCVHEHAEAWRSTFESRPIEWFGRKCPEVVRAAAVEVAEFLGSDSDTTGFVVNATAGVNAVLRDIHLESGDEVIVFDHGYGAVKQTIRHTVASREAVMVEVKVPIPLDGPQPILDAIEASITPRTRLAVIDQITSPSAIVMPVKDIVDSCHRHGVPVLVDGAHAPGMLERPAAGHGAQWWTGNLHKWVCAPKGCAVLCADADHAGSTHPPVISHGLGESLATEFDWQGTRDVAPWLTAPFAISFWDRYGGIAKVRERNHRLCCEVHRMLLGRFDVSPITPRDGSMLGSMATLPLPAFFENSSAFASTEVLLQILADRYKVEVPVLELDGQWHIRISVQVYNDWDDYLRLADAIDELRGEGS